MYLPMPPSWLEVQILSGIFKKDFIYLFLERGEGREKEREINILLQMPLPTQAVVHSHHCSKSCQLPLNRKNHKWFSVFMLLIFLGI